MIEVGKTVFIDDLCPKNGHEKFSEELGLDAATKVELVHRVSKTRAEVEYFQIVSGVHRSEIVEVTTTLGEAREPRLATARWLYSPAALVWLKYAIWDARRWNIELKACGA